MKTHFNSIGLETEIIRPNGIEEDQSRDVVADVVKAYTQLNIPIIAGLAIVPKDFDFSSYDCANEDSCDTFGHHAVVT
jgi:hypothetical protein